MINRATYSRSISPALKQAPAHIIESMNEARAIAGADLIPFKGVATDKLKAKARAIALRKKRKLQQESPTERVQRIAKAVKALNRG